MAVPVSRPRSFLSALTGALGGESNGDSRNGDSRNGDSRNGETHESREEAPRG